MAFKKIFSLLIIVYNSNTIIYSDHIIYNTNGAPLTEELFNNIKSTVLDLYEFPMALNNPNYNPNGNETEIIESMLQRYKNEQNQLDLHVRWIPSTLYDLFRYKYSKNIHDEYNVNNIIQETFIHNPQATYETEADYYLRIAEPLIHFFDRKINQEYDIFFKGYKSSDAIEPTIIQTITTEINQHIQNPHYALFYRGKASLKDFNTEDAFNLGLFKEYSTYCLNATGKETQRPEMLSYGISLLSGSRENEGTCPLLYALCICSKKGFHANADLYILPIPKKFFTKKTSFWWVNNMYDAHKSFYGNDSQFHPRRKAITTFAIMEKSFKIENQFTQDDPRVLLHKELEEALMITYKAKIYLLKNAIGLTKFTKKKIRRAQEHFAKGSVYGPILLKIKNYWPSLLRYKDQILFILNKVYALRLNYNKIFRNTRIYF